MLAETGEATFFVAQLISETDAATRLLDDVKDRAIQDYKTEKAILSAKVEAQTADAGQDSFLNAEQATFKRSGTGLDHPAASLIAGEAFALDANSTGIVETGDAAILVRLDKVLPATDDDVSALAKQLTTSFARTVQSDWTAALALELSEKFDLQMNPEAVRLLLVQASN